ncbi:hypothetical protein RFI_11875, partial [Reticulomyxa filosa]
MKINWRTGQAMAAKNIKDENNCEKAIHIVFKRFQKEEGKKGRGKIKDSMFHNPDTSSDRDKLLAKVRADRQLRQYEKQKIDVCNVIQRHWRMISARLAYANTLRKHFDGGVRQLANDLNLSPNQQQVPIARQCNHNVHSLVQFYYHQDSVDRNRATIIFSLINKSMSIEAKDISDYHLLLYGLSLSDVSMQVSVVACSTIDKLKQEMWRRDMCKLWRISMKLMESMYEEVSGTAETTKSNSNSNPRTVINVKTVIGFVLNIMNIHNVRLSKMTDELKEFVKQCIISPMKHEFYWKWKMTLMLAQHYELNDLAQRILVMSHVACQLDAHLLQDFVEQIVSIPNLWMTHPQVFVSTETSTGLAHISPTILEWLPLIANHSSQSELFVNERSAIALINNCAVLFDCIDTMTTTTFEDFMKFYGELVSKYRRYLTEDILEDGEDGHDDDDDDDDNDDEEEEKEKKYEIDDDDNGLDQTTKDRMEMELEVKGKSNEEEEKKEMTNVMDMTDVTDMTDATDVKSGIDVDGDSKMNDKTVITLDDMTNKDKDKDKDKRKKKKNKQTKTFNPSLENVNKLCDSKIVLKLFWRIFQHATMTINQQRYVYRATEPLGKDLQKHIAQAIDLPITRTILEFAHTLIITFSSLHDVRKEYISTLSFFTPCVSCVWELLVHEIGLSPSGSNNVDIWKDALWVNSSVHQLLDLFLLLYNNHLFVMEKEEFVQQISPFTISTLPSLIQILK